MAKLKEIVRFRGERLFNGAVCIDWFWTDEAKRRAAAESFVFHGPTYHGVTQADVGITHGHSLQDTASFTRAVVRRCHGQEEQPFTLAIAGYGTGKSHLALTLATLLTDPAGREAQQIFQALNSADETIGCEVRALLQEEPSPFLVVALNGMQNFDLTAEVTRQILTQVRARDLDVRALDELRPRFRQAANLIDISSDAVIAELLAACGMADTQAVRDALENQDEQIYKQVHDFFSSRGMPIRALGGDSTKELINVTVREYCGVGKPFASLVILFDEFGKYTEFATVRSQIAGSGVLQDMFEGVQANADVATFIGFIQFELNAYLQRVAPEFRNEIQRYITRYQGASKAYLSINLETLIAHLLEKKDPGKLEAWFGQQIEREKSEKIAENLHSWFPQSLNHRLWNDSEQFHTIIRKGCWPLSPFSSWLLFYLTAEGKHLQERSALYLLGDIFDRVSETEVPDDGSWSIAPVDLWSDAFQEELIASEDTGQQGSITHAYSSVIARHGNQLTVNLKSLLRAIVLSSKLGLQANSKEHAIAALADLAGVLSHTAHDGIVQLQDEYNVIDWDQSFRQFDILGDSVPRTQFLSFIRQRVASSFDEDAKARLFASKSQDWCDLLSDLDCDFAEENCITTREWRYEAMTSTLEFLETNLKFAASRWSNAVGVEDARGTVVYCYVERSRNPEEASGEVRRMLRGLARDLGFALPIFVVLLCDEKGVLGQTLAELAVLKESLTGEERVRFGNLVGAHTEKGRQIIRIQIDDMIKSRQYVTMLNEELDTHRLRSFGSKLFAQIYKKPIPFPFDGFSTARGNAADTCQQMITDLLQANLDYDSMIAKPAKVKNRAMAVLKGSWGIFTRTGTVSRRPSNSVVCAITETWDRALQSEERRLVIGKALRQICMPPYGANIASAGLLFGIYVAPRMEKLIVLRNGHRYAIKQWLQDGIFRGKFLDIDSLDNNELMLLGEESAEWETLLDEWEPAESYSEQIKFLQRAHELNTRVPTPPMLGYRFAHLEEKAREATQNIHEVGRQQNEALQKMEDGYNRDDVSKLIWGTASLTDIRKRMIDEKPLWTDNQIDEFQSHIERGRQAIIQIFPDWLPHQRPANASPDTVGEFKHKMLRLCGGNLKKLGLIDQYQELENRVELIVRNAVTADEARQLIFEVSSWLEQHVDVFHIIRIKEISSLRKVGKNMSSKLQGMTQRINMPEISDARAKLTDFLSKLEDAEDSVKKRADALWQSKIRSKENMEALLIEVETLTKTFEGSDLDLEDYRLMRGALQTYQQDYRQLLDERLTWSEFESLSATLQGEAVKSFGDEELPWPPDETIPYFVNVISKQRKQTSLTWIQQIESEVKGIAEMSAVEANRFHEKASNSPPLLTEGHIDRAAKVVKQIEARLEVLKIDWLVEKFKELHPQARKKFLKIASDLSEQM